eukprot:PhM_4_TR17386/c0_g3_i6/m.32779
MSRFGFQCTQKSSCDFYSDVLLVIKLNPVRMLWLDILLRFYGTGFPNIIIFSTMDGKDLDKTDMLYIGARRMPVHLFDDNRGFCDHHTVALAMKWFPNTFSGFIYLSDDVQFSFWQTIGFDKTKVWRQRTELRQVALSSAEMDPKMKTVIHEANLASLFPTHIPFASTSGLYYVPKHHDKEFFRVSRILLKHRTYNEWGTPFVLHSVDKGSFAALPGKLVWRHRRLQVRGMFSFDRAWLHPVRASGELFSRLVELVHDPDFSDLRPNSIKMSTEDFFGNTCFACYTNPVAERRAKGLYHTCRLVAANSQQQSKICGRKRKSISSYAKEHFPEYRHAHNVGGWVAVLGVDVNGVSNNNNKSLPGGGGGTKNTLEMTHEGFWNAKVSSYIFNSYYPLLNTTQQVHPFLSAYPKCCVLGSP